MKYISIGAVASGSTEYILKIAHGGYSFQLDGVLAKLWLNGRSQFNTVEEPIDIKGLTQLLKMGLAIQAEECDAGEYRALTQCTLVPAECKFPFLFLHGIEKQVLTWLRGAGLVLSMAELEILVSMRYTISNVLGKCWNSVLPMRSRKLRDCRRRLYGY